MPRGRIEDLRPIGTVFTETSPPDKSSTNPYAHKYTYQVKGYVVASTSEWDTEGFWAEALDVIAVEEVSDAK